MIRKRSSHIPTTMQIDAITVPVIVRSRLMARIGTGIRKLSVTMVQNSGAKSPRTVDQKTPISDSPLAYQVVSRSANVK